MWGEAGIGFVAYSFEFLNEETWFEQCPTDACVFQLVEGGIVSISAVVHGDDIFAVERKGR